MNKKMRSLKAWVPVLLQGSKCHPIGHLVYLKKKEAIKKWDGWGPMVALKEVKVQVS